MKKFSLFTATLLTVTALGGQSLTVQAANNNWQTTTATLNGNRVVVAYNGNLTSSSLLDKLSECIPGLKPILPDCEMPDTETPKPELPDIEIPGTQEPDTNKPDDTTPDSTPNTKPDAPPVNDKPENGNPGSNKPGNGSGINKPNKPENGNPGSDQDLNKPSYAQQVVTLVNKERAKEGLSALTVDTKVRAAAQVRAQEIEVSFSHTRPDGTKFTTALKDQGVSYKSAGENIAWGQRSPEEVVNAWMNSPGHRANIMNPNFKIIGVGYYQDASGVKYWSQLFTG